ncbi:AMP-binding enzyme [Actinomadura sp. HBU206391]|uniref:AMP-binding enzyme n=1 Tax=Actinomadura sp. HBU206391 TaxID=2731692 RepID=UPI00164EEC25|nr:hypothetical protein [Actinomadura sp. HBU206391]MBC6460677.1 hypothetical protein [Actinomadura sp. HBU206391]
MAQVDAVTPTAVESSMAAHPDVLQCVVITRVERSGERTLTVHYVLRPAATLCATELYDYLARRLPSGAIPIRLRRHVAFPPSRNGTLDLDSMS